MTGYAGSAALTGFEAATAPKSRRVAQQGPSAPKRAKTVRGLLIVGVSVLALSLGACAERPKTTAGAAIGAAGGGLLAAALGGGAAGIAAGVLLGGLAGGAAGNALDNADREYAARAQQQAMETTKTGQTVNWVNPDSGNQGTYTPQAAYQDSSGQYCREFQQTITVDGKTENAFGVACRQADGTWKIRDKS